MKRLLWFILLISIFLISCTKDNKENVVNKLEKTLDKYQGYKTEVDITINMEEKESFYSIKESYFSGEDKYIVEIIDPLKSNSIEIQYEGDKISIKHASIEEYISLKSDDRINKGMLFGELIKDLNSINKVKVEKLDDIAYYVFYVDVKEKNQYTEEIKIWLQKKDFKPYMLNILDKDMNPRAIYKYKNFEYIKG